MSTLALERAKVHVPQCSSPDPELATRARKVLGYGAGEKVATARKAEAEKYQRIHDAFETVGIEPYSKESVGRYKEKKLRKANRFLGLLKWANSEAGGSVWVGSMILGIVSLTLNGVFGPGFHSHSPWLYAWYIPLASLVVFLGVPGIAICGEGKREFKWKTTKIDSYREPIPEFAQSRAIELKQHCPEVEFYVEELKADKVIDPFLVAYFGHDQYYIDVWDEPAFEGRLTK